MKDEQLNKSSTYRKTLIGGTASINDLRDVEYNEGELTPQERLALKNFDRYRISTLNMQKTEKQFHEAYMKVQVMANLTPYVEFLKEEYYF